MRLALMAAAALALTACSKTDSGDVGQAKDKISAAGSDTAAAANHLAAAAARDIKADSHGAAEATGAALEKAGKDIRADTRNEQSQ